DVCSSDLLLAPQGSAREKRYLESDIDVAATCEQLMRYGVDPRNLRTFRTATSRQAALIEQLFAPALRGRNAERRQQALRDMQQRSEEHTSELQSQSNLVCRLLLEKKKKNT